MTKITKVLGVLSAIGLVSGMIFVTGLIDVSQLALLYVTLPAGAILLGLFMISNMLEKETALYDEEQRKIIAAVDSQAPRETSLQGAVAPRNSLARSKSA